MKTETGQRKKQLSVLNGHTTALLELGLEPTTLRSETRAHAVVKGKFNLKNV